MSIYSTLLAYGSTTATATVVYTVPSGVTCVIRDIEVRDFSGGNNTFNLQLNVSGTLFTPIQLLTTSSASHTQWQGRVVLENPDTIAVASSVAGHNYAISGYQLQ